MKLKLLILIFISCSFGAILPQPADTMQTFKLRLLNSLYNNLEYPTTAFNDLKKTWVVTDPVFVREIFNKFVVKSALRVNGAKPTIDDLQEKSKDIYLGNVFIDLRKRYYDDEIELLRFFKESSYGRRDSTDFFFDPITDFVYLREVVGPELYQELKKQFYALNDLTKTFYDSKYAYNFNIYLHLLEPELMFWSLTTKGRNKYLASLIGRWGNDHIPIPGWYYPNYVTGLKVTYIDSLINNRAYNSYVGEIGFGLPARQPDLGFEPDDVGRRMFYTGAGFYIKVIGSPLGYIYRPIKDIELKLQGFFTLSQLKSSDIGLSYLTKFYSTRNYITFFAKYPNIFDIRDAGTIYAGAGYSAFDVKYYALIPGITKLVDINGGGAGFKHVLNTEAGIEGEGGLLNYKFAAMLNHNFSDADGYLGVNFYFMLTNTIGLDFRFHTGYRFGNTGTPFYRSDNYVVFSPVFRINY
ncbi:MAG: hypothetical protein HUU54_00495 [Ignavibacteriaceae bacterium]|nr:hypothetical protein [Ignavibacteriaceae bacterium]